MAEKTEKAEDKMAEKQEQPQTEMSEKKEQPQNQFFVMEDELIDKLKNKGLVTVVSKKCHDGINRIINSYRKRVIYIDPTGCHLVYYEIPKAFEKDNKKDDQKNGKKGVDPISSDDEYKILHNIGEPRGYFPLKFITEVSEYVKGKISKPRNIILKCKNQHVVLKFATDELGAKWLHILRYLTFEAQQKTNYLIEYLSPNGQLVDRKKFWFKAKDLDKTVRAYLFIIIDCQKVYGDNFHCDNIINQKLRKFGGELTDVFEIKIDQGKAEAYLFLNFDEINPENMKTGVIYCQYSPKLQVLFELKKLKHINLIPAKDSQGSFGLNQKHKNDKSDVTFWTKSGVILRNWISLITVFHLQHNVDDWVDYPFYKLFEIDKKYEILLAENQNQKYIDRDEHFIMKKYFPKLTEKQMNNYANLSIGSLLQGVCKHKNLGLKQIGNEVVEIEEIPSPVKKRFVDDNHDFMKVHSRFDQSTKLTPKDLKDYKKQTEINFDSNIPSNRHIQESYYDNQDQRTANEKSKYQKQNISATYLHDLNVMEKEHRINEYKDEPIEIVEDDIDMLELSKKGKIPFRRAKNDMGFIVIYYKNGTIAYTGNVEQSTKNNYPTGKDISLFDIVGNRIFRGDIKEKKIDKSRTAEFHQEINKDCKLEHYSEIEYLVDFKICLNPYVLKNVIVSSRTIGPDWKPCNPVQKRTKKLDYWSEQTEFESSKLKNSEKNQWNFWYYVGHMVHGIEHGFGKLYLQTPENNQIKIYEGKFHEGRPMKGMLYTGDRKYHEYKDCGQKLYVDALKRHLIRENIIDMPKQVENMVAFLASPSKRNKFRDKKQGSPEVEIVVEKAEEDDKKECFYESTNGQNENAIDFEQVQQSLIVSTRQNNVAAEKKSDHIEPVVIDIKETPSKHHLSNNKSSKSIAEIKERYSKRNTSTKSIKKLSESKIKVEVIEVNIE